MATEIQITACKQANLFVIYKTLQFSLLWNFALSYKKRPIHSFVSSFPRSFIRLPIHENIPIYK